MRAHFKQCIAGLLLLSSWHCAQAQAQTREDFLNAPDRVQWDAGALYDGRFDDGTPFQIELAYPRPEAVSQEVANGFVQALWYPRHYEGTPSTLLAAGGAGLQMRLAVANAQGGASDEHYAVTLSTDRASGRGVWTGPGTAGQRAFTLQRALPYVGVVVKRPASADLATSSPYYREHGFVFSSFFPVTGNPDADGWIRQEAGACRDIVDCANTVRILWRSSSLLSLRATLWGDSAGAHGNAQSHTRQYGIVQGAMTPLGLDAFIDRGTRCREQVSAAIVGQLGAKGMSWAEKAGLDAPRELKFTPTPSGLAFHYDPYEAGSYVQGAPTVFVPRNLMGNCVLHLPAED